MHDFNGFLPDMSLLASQLNGVDLIFICNPNNPSGALIPKEQLLAFLDEAAARGVIVVVDEAFIDFVKYPEGAHDIVKGILDELKDADLHHGMALTGSTEKNIPTRQTGLGVTAIGTCRIKDIKAGLTLPGDVVYCVGIPKVGDEVNIHDPDIVTLKTVRILRSMDEVHEIVPVGSKGIQKEAELLARLASVTLELEELDPNGASGSLDLSKTAGPATCLVFSAEPDKNFLARLSGLVSQPVSAIGVCRG